MKGIVFTEFFNMVEKQFSIEVLDKIIMDSKLPNDGAYTLVGTYDYKELITMVQHLSRLTNIPVPDLERAYGHYLFKQLVQRYPGFVQEANSAFEFLKGIDDHIHVEVRKLYPDAELPRFYYDVIDTDCLIMDYHSSRPFADLAQGLMESCIDEYKEKITIERELIKEKNNEFVRFTLNRKE